MRRERRQPTRREWAQITSPRPVVRRIPKPPLNPSRRREGSTTAPPFGPGLTDDVTRKSEGENES